MYIYIIMMQALDKHGFPFYRTIFFKLQKIHIQEYLSWIAATITVTKTGTQTFT
ncbi:hypothetical protein Lgee_0850 [Legionella geestiana]|uniref:Uncharacterized protein n=1 Tax=Legionella geestiana TaxID=45065 RepID=A0A0W0U0J8_9GAMM|nr:hypothetical protein Lgee_0850 [Legionella geestiana]STX55247.1 Uncharacterised protein [Legionella geestiana]